MGAGLSAGGRDGAGGGGEQDSGQAAGGGQLHPLPGTLQAGGHGRHASRHSQGSGNRDSFKLVFKLYRNVLVFDGSVTVSSEIVEHPATETDLNLGCIMKRVGNCRYRA